MSELPNGWDVKTLGEVAVWGSGGTPQAGNPKYYGGSIPWAIIGDLNDGVVYSTEKSITEEGLADSSAKLVPAGAILIAMYGSIGKMGIAGVPMATNQAIAFALPNQDLVLPSYLFWFLSSQREQFLSQGKGATQQNISQTLLKAWQIPVPPLDEQRRIVETLEDHLSRLDKALADLEVAARRSQHLFLAALEKAIEECSETTYQPLADCLNLVDQKKKVQRGWSPQCLSHPQSDTSNWAVLKTTAVQNMRYEPQHNKELPKTLEPKTHLEVQVGDFLMTTTGPRNRCGVVCLVTSTPRRLIFSGKILRFKPDSTKLLPSWLELVLASHKYQKQLDRLKVGSSDSSVSIGNTQVLELSVPVPSLAEQRRRVGEVEKMKALAERFEMEIEQEAKKFKQLRKALLHSAFSGNLGGK